jgi:protein required for attachment to host cells
MQVRVVVADDSVASFFDVADAKAPLIPAGKLENAASRLHDRDLESDRPGRGHLSSTGRGSALDDEHSAKRTEQERFARRVAAEVEYARIAQRFDRLVVIAGPRMLGLLRKELSPQASKLIAAEISKDLLHADTDAIRRYVPRTAFRSTDGQETRPV